MDRKRVHVFDALEIDKPYLDKCGILNHVKGLLTKLIENRPKDVVEFMAEYFDGAVDKPDRVAKAQRQIFLIHHSKPAYQNNVQIAYDILCQNKGVGHVKGLTGVLYMELLAALCRQFPESVKEKLLKKLSCRDDEVVVFGIFKSSVFICVVLQDFIAIAEEIYTVLESSANDEVDGLILDVIVQQLKEAVCKPCDQPHSLLEAGYLLAPDRIYLALATAMFRGGTIKTKRRDDFITECANIFIEKVVSLR